MICTGFNFVNHMCSLWDPPLTVILFILICLSRAFVMDDDLLEIEMKIKSHFTVKILCFVVVLMFHYSNFLITTT